LYDDLICIEKGMDHTMKARGAALRRSRTNRIVAGVCGGLGDFFGVDPFWFRLAFLIAILPGGVPGLAAYLIMWLIVPPE
jgi:phage shock protein C